MKRRNAVHDCSYWTTGWLTPESQYELVLFYEASRQTLGPTKPSKLWIPDSLSQGVKQTNYLQQVPRLRMHTAIPSLPNICSLHGPKHTNNFVLSFYLSNPTAKTPIGRDRLMM